MFRWLGWLLFGFHGRIPRKLYWFAAAILTVAGIGVHLAMHGPKLSDPHAPITGPDLLVRLLFLISATAVTRKRLNDRGHKLWLTLLWLAMNLITLITLYYNPPDPDQITTSQAIFLAVTMVASLWFFIELGCLRGEQGPNSYGPDPLGSTDPIAPRHRRTIGENVRDGITGFAALIVVLFLGGFRIEPLVNRLMMPEMMRGEREVLRLREENGPAMAAQETAKAAYRAKDYDEALRQLTRAIELFGEDSRLAGPSYVWRAIVLERMNRSAEALDNYNKAVSVNPAASFAYAQRADLLTKLGRYEEALRDVDVAHADDPNSVWSYMDRGDLLAEARRHDEALVEFDKAMTAADETLGTTIWLYNKIATMLPAPEKEKYSELGERMISLRDERRAEVYTHRGNLFRITKEWDKALQDYAEALRLAPDSRSIYVNRGWLYEQQGKIGLARADYEKAATLGRNDEWLKNALERTRN